MERREFLRRLTFYLAAGWTWQEFSRPLPALAAEGQAIRLAFLADAHLKNGEAHRAEAQALARAVSEIKALHPAPHLVLFAGDLAHRGHPQALALGREILSDLPAPLAAVMGEGDAGASWQRFFGAPRWSRPYQDLQIFGLHTSWRPGPGGPVFYLGGSQRRWLAEELSRLDPLTPLILLSHAPLARQYLPWQQWTVDAPRLAPLLARFRRVYCFHGHVHSAGSRGPGPGLIKISPGWPSRLHQGLPATAWPLPLPLQGTPAILRPGLGPAGCGWSLVSLGSSSWDCQPQVWQI
jgi:3',5'-cyclic-AMP phosphodiesterase